jgi:lysozyme
MCALAVCAAGCSPVDDPTGVVEQGLRVCPKGATTKGVDVSHYQGTINWANVHAAGIGFAFMKATENVDFVDPTYATNWAAAGQNGVVRGAYHFFRPAVDAVAQADYFLQHAGAPAAGDLPLTLDLEVTDGLGGAAVAQAALAFLARVEEQTGRTPIVYTSPSFFTSTLGSPSGFERYVLWIANWGVTCPNVPAPAWNDWVFWQDADNGTVNGIPGAVDTDVFNGSLSDLQKFANPVAPDMAQPVDAAVAPDAGSDDAGPPIGQAKGGCGCDVGAAGGATATWPATIVALAFALALARRRALAFAFARRGRRA